MTQPTTKSALFELTDFDETRPADTLPCGHNIHTIAHYEECLNATCPTCHITERNGYTLLHEHDPLHRARRGEPCLMQSWHWKRVASCLGCANWTFGTHPCRNTLCAFSDPDTPADPALWQPHPTYQTWWYPMPYYPPTNHEIQRQP